MNNNNPKVAQQHAEGFFNRQLSGLNYHALHPQVPYVGSLERSMFVSAEDLANIDPRVVNNLMRNYVSGSNTGKHLNIAAGLKAPGHLTHPNSLGNGGHNDINVQGANIPIEAMHLQGLMQMQNIGMYLQNPSFNLQKEEFPALPIFRGGIMDYPVEMHPKEQLHDYSISQLQPQQLPAGQTVGFQLANQYLLHNQQHLSPTFSGARMGNLQSNNDTHLQPHVVDLLPSTLDVTANNMELVAAGINQLNLAGTHGWSNDKNVYQHMRHTQTQIQMPRMQSANNFNIEGNSHTQKWKTRHSAESYGMLGLLDVMKPSQSILVPAHGLGIDLTNLGLNLTQSADIHNDFLSPFSEKSVTEYHSPHFVIPECYNAMRAADLQPSWFSRLSLETLFYIFYSMPKDVAQIYAAHELMNQKWFYHKEHRLWFTRGEGTNTNERTDAYERGTFIYFSPTQWTTIPKADLIIKYESIEKRPALPGQSLSG